METNNFEIDSTTGFDFDAGSFYSKVDQLSDSKRFDAVKNVSKAEKKFVYSCRSSFGTKRRFLPNWLSNFSWLVYCKKLDVAFCLPCVPFGRSICKNRSKIICLVKSPFNDWYCASRVFNDHESKSDVHETALLSMQSFCGVMENKVKPISQIQDIAFDRIVSFNRKKLESVVNCVVFHGRQNFPFRGTTIHAKHYDSEGCDNFQALLSLRVDSVDKV